MTGYRPADTVRAPTGTSAPVIERSPSAGDRKQRATSGRGTVPTIVDRTLRRQAADDTVVSLRAIGSYVASNFPMFSESSAESLATCGLFAPRRDRTMPPLRQVHGPRVDCHGACRERRYSFRTFWVADEPPLKTAGSQVLA